MKLEYFIIDATAPFFVQSTGSKEINWSKIPFRDIEMDGVVDPAKKDGIIGAFKRYVNAVTAAGYNSVTLDDCAHLVNNSIYPEKLNGKIDSYKALYRQLVGYARERGCRVFITTDLMFFNSAIEQHTHSDRGKVIRFLCRTIHHLFRDFQQVEGIIVRFGESDGIDVEGDFTSRLIIKTARQCRRVLKELLQVCEHHEKQLVVRTWTLGAFPVGDLMWNPKTFNAVFGDLPIDNLIISQKFGETDFFRYLTMSPLLFEGNHRRIVEFQARREYEGFGEFPSFIGFDYERYARYLGNSPVLCGISVWCQTGGWSHFKRITYLENSSPWVELNLETIIAIFRDGISAEEAAEGFLGRRFPGSDGSDGSLFIKFLRRSDKAVKELWYIPEFAVQRLYFRRTRVPPLFYLFWDTIMINHTVRKIIRRFVHERREAVHDGYRALHAVDKMRKMAMKLPFGGDDVEFQYRTFQLLALAREYYFGEWHPELQKRITDLVKKYNDDYPEGFHVVADFNPVRFKKWLIKTIFRVSLRRHPQYRVLDRIFFLRFASLIYPLFRIWEKRRMPAFTRNQAMGIEVLFR